MSDQSQPTRPLLTRLLLVLVPLGAMLGAFVWIASLDPLRSFNNGAPAVEALTVERTILAETGIGLLVRAGGSEPMVIAQVAVDDAFWTFTQDPPGPIARGDTVWVQIPYPWVLGEAHLVNMLLHGMIASKTYEKLIPRHEREALEQALGMDSGYVLDFSDRTFNDFFYETIAIDPEDQSQLFNGRGTSKAKRLRSFIERAQPALAAKILREMWEYREAIGFAPSVPNEGKLKESYFSIVARIEGRADAIDTSAIETFEPNETLEELVASIRRDLDANKPQAALDRLHTYCMKRFASLVRKHGGGECGKDDALHARVAKYVNRHSPSGPPLDFKIA